MNEKRRYLIAEYCRGPFYMGWHLYFRENIEQEKRNKNGGWGWIRHPKEDKSLIQFLDDLGIKIQGDGSCDYDGIAEISRRFPIPRQRISGKPRGCIEVAIDDRGQIRICHDQTQT